MSFDLDPKLMTDSFFVIDLQLCQLRLINNASYPWLILVPRLENIVEITDLEDQAYATLGQEIRYISQVMQKLFEPDKLNIASIGNIVQQLHVHLVARYQHDPLFPKPVWGSAPLHYRPEAATRMIQQLVGAIQHN